MQGLMIGFLHTPDDVALLDSGCQRLTSAAEGCAGMSLNLQPMDSIRANYSACLSEQTSGLSKWVVALFSNSDMSCVVSDLSEQVVALFSNNDMSCVVSDLSEQVVGNAIATLSNHDSTTIL
jgi:hypothetical protein